MLQLIQITSQVKTTELWIPPLRLHKMPCERCALMAQHATWSISGDGNSRHAWLHIHCEDCFEHADWPLLHALKIEEYEQRRADTKRPALAKVAGF